ADKESTIYYTLDGTAPGPGSKKYTGPIPTDGKLQVKAIAYEKASRKSSPVTIAQFGVARKDWKIIDIADDKSKAMLDGDPFTTWHQQAKTLPAELVIDLGHDENLSGFRYLPDQDLWNPGIITQYEFYVSVDNKNWKLVDQGEFANIKNNPLWQSKTFATEKARYIKIRALRTAENNGRIGYAEIDVIIR
ncbi:MAG: discoidin domain-containing protein, partial [Flavitalea sp.]